MSTPGFDRQEALSLSDIADLRAYERVRQEVRSRVIELKKSRRVRLGDLVTVVFENRETVRFQVQEMVRAEKMITDEAVQSELDTYNSLIPGPGELSATLFLELRSEEQLRKWLPALVGIQASLELRLGHDGDDVIRSRPEQSHAAHLTRSEVTASVHYVRWSLDPSQVDKFDAGPAVLSVAHPEYQASSELGQDVRRSLLSDLRQS
ncbi:MAG: DUF3501 family protein [Actinomycetota bacterium]|nr:DUF3501 family protein [Actinomycetota bacterium]